MFIFPVQLTTSRIGNLTRLIHTLLYVMTVHTYIHFIVKGIVNELHRCDGRNGLWCAEDGGRGVCSSDVHYLVQIPVSAAEMQFIYGTRSPRARQIAGRVVCGSKVDIVAGSSTRDSTTMEKSFLQLVFEVLCALR